MFNKIYEKAYKKVRIFHNMTQKNEKSISNIYKFIKNELHPHENMHKSCKTF